MGLGPIWLPRQSRQADDDQDSRQETRSSEPAIGLPPSPDSVATPGEPSLPPETSPTPVCMAGLKNANSMETPLPLLAWQDLQQTVRQCQRCRLGATRQQAVFGRGNPSARWLLVGEAPGEQEDLQGVPFVGRAGQLLNNMLQAAGLQPEQDVYITNVLKCRPPGNRNPASDEIVSCQDYLQQQIRHVQPTIIIALGRFAAQTLLNTDKSVSRLRKQVHQYQGIPLIASFHPAYLLRNPPEKANAWHDWLLAKRIQAEQGST